MCKCLQLSYLNDCAQFCILIYFIFILTQNATASIVSIPDISSVLSGDVRRDSRALDGSAVYGATSSAQVDMSLIPCAPTEPKPNRLRHKRQLYQNQIAAMTQIAEHEGHEVLFPVLHDILTHIMNGYVYLSTWRYLT